MKKYFLTGLILLLPTALTIVIAIWIFDLLTEPFVGIVEHLIVSFEARHGVDVRNHTGLIVTVSRIIVLILLCIITFLLGFFGRRVVFRSLLHWSDRLFNKIPIIKTIYTIAHDVTKGFLQDGKSTFQKTVLIPFPRPDTHALGLVTGEIPDSIKKAMPDVNLAVFVPTSPHPISGYILLSSQKEVVDVDMSSEDVFRYLISCGLALPNELKPQHTSNTEH